MTSLERVMRRLKGKPVDKIPNLNIIMTFAAKYIGVSYGEYVTDYRKLVEGNIRCAEEFGIDAVSAISDPMREASAFGADVIILIDDVPYCERNLLKDAEDISSLQIVDPLSSPRTLDRIRAIELYRELVGNEYAIIGWVEGVLAEAAVLRGLNELMIDLATEEQDLTPLFDIIFKQQCAFAKAQVEAGAHIIGIGNAAASLIGPRLYQKYALPYDKNLIAYIHDLGARVKLHICGNITPLLPLLREVGADILDVDHMVDFKNAIETFSDLPVSICGNMDPVSVFLQGDEKTICDAVNKCISACNSTTMIAAGCEIPRDTPPQNLKMMDKLLWI